jgi:hypothetical protein
MIELLIALLLILAVMILLLVIRFSTKIEKISVSQDIVKGAFATCWRELGIDQDIGAIKQRAEDIKNVAQSLQDIFKIAKGRSVYGSLSSSKYWRIYYHHNTFTSENASPK